jgi:hypothetical protein
VKLLDKTVAALGALLALCLAVSVGARLVSRSLPALLAVLGLAVLFRWLWQGHR